MKISLRMAMMTGVLALTFAARADDVKVAVKDLPKAVAAAVKARFPKAQITDAEKITEDGKTTYEVSLKDGKNELDATYSADGKLLSLETEVAVKDLPPPVTDAVKGKYPKGTMKSAAWIVDYDGAKETKYYGVIVSTGAKKDRELSITLAGEIKADEEAEDE